MAVLLGSLIKNPDCKKESRVLRSWQRIVLSYCALVRLYQTDHVTFWVLATDPEIGKQLTFKQRVAIHRKDLETVTCQSVQRTGALNLKKTRIILVFIRFNKLS